MTTESKRKEAETIVNDTLERFGEKNQQDIINTLRTRLLDAPELKDKLNKQGYTLTHLAVIHGYHKLLEMLLNLDVDINIRTPRTNMDKINCADMTAYEMALIMDVPSNIKELFEQKGANEEEALAYILPEQNWPSDHQPAKALVSLREKLKQFCNNKQATLWDTSSGESSAFWARITKYLEVLTWPIDDQGYSALHHLFTRNDTGAINYIQTQNFSKLKEVRNLRNQHTLFDFIAIHGQLKHYTLLVSLAAMPNDRMRAFRLAVISSQLTFCCKLLQDKLDPNYEFDLNTDVPPTESLLKNAAQRGDAPMCELLLTSGINPNLPETHPTKIGDWTGDKATNPLQQFADKLKMLSRGKLSSEEQTKQINFLCEYPWFLDWPLTRDRTVLHYCFQYNQDDQDQVIKELFDHPKWDYDAKLKNKNLFDVIASTGCLRYYETLKPDAHDSSAYNSALVSAVMTGQTRFCQRLMADGVSPENCRIGNQTCYDYWVKQHLDKENPFTPSLDWDISNEAHNLWQTQKQRLLEYMEKARVRSGVGSCHFFAVNKSILPIFNQLEKHIQDMMFNPGENIKTQVEEIFLSIKVGDLSLKTNYEHTKIKQILATLRAFLNTIDEDKDEWHIMKQGYG